MLQQHGRATYRALQRQFDLDDAYLEDLKDALLFAHPVADEPGRGLVWTGEADAMPTSPPTPPPSADPEGSQSAGSGSGGPPPPDAERRQLTVMFCDLADSTRLSGQLDPEDLRDVIRAYQETAASVIQRYEGYIAQYLGDGLLVYFGWPQAHEDDAHRGVYAGLGIAETMNALNDQLERDKGVHLAVRIGIHTGPVVIGEMGGGGRYEQLALGRTTNIASRLEGLARPNTVVISDTTYRLVDGYFVCDDLGLHELKGVETPLRTYQARQATGVQGRLDMASTRGLTPLVGRESEVRLLLERWAQVREGQGQVLLLSGEAGIGKSRLVQVLKEHIADEPHIRLECRSSPYYQNTALYPITDMLQHALRWQQDDPLDRRLAKLEQMLGQYSFVLEETIPLFSELLSLSLPENKYPQLRWSPQRQRQKTLEAVVKFLLKQSEKFLLLFIIEDLHWADPTTLELLDLLVDEAPTASLLILLTCRPEFELSWDLQRHCAMIDLSRFSHMQIATMVQRMMKGKTLPTQVMQHLVEKTDGVPLFIEEMTKMLLASELLHEEEIGYVLTGSLLQIDIPETLQDSLMARLDRLHEAKEIAQLGAVLGREFSYGIISIVSLWDEHILQSVLSQLVEAEILYQEHDPPHARYIFKHALIQDAAYASLLRSTRQQHHRQIAELLTSQFPETAATQPELIAHHYTQAGCDEQAVVYWRMAGQRAMERSANAEAVSHLNRGLELVMSQPETSARARQELALHIALGGPLIAIKGYASPEIAHSTTRARELAEQVGNEEQRFAVLYRQWVYQYSLPDCQAALAFGEEFLKLAERQGDPALILTGHRILGATRFSLGELVGARDHLEQTLSLYHPERHRALTFRFAQEPQVACQVFLSLVLWLLGYRQQAIQLSRDALAQARALEHMNTLGYALFFGGELLALFRHQVEAVEQHTQALIGLSEEQGLRFWGAYAIAGDGWTQVLRGRKAYGLQQIARGMAELQATGAAYFLPFLLTLQAEAYAEDAQHREGLRLLEQALARVDATGECVWEAEVYRLAGELLQHADGGGRWAAWSPETCFQKALDIARRQQAKSLELRAAINLARLWRHQGKRQDAVDLLAPIHGWFAKGFETADLMEAQALLETLQS